ncbi:type 2 lantipeptide synthetase LanM family protein [Streptomonospora sp. S1-112]|uniref:Type 2 lantipeptide synthetase LanM family protein n=1 Tax=Streptomonospora mangrovi TaxID=2883123 RepID=A0A9X3SHA8_9ACTN|nr:type 2 lanthipeptide synthetase LanM family protein [Streptomonospora mangrovi]MDA0566910.1 type 2 lantipeptide synthetase LanM family protein [Streptomonospora mangrovi]
MGNPYPADIAARACNLAERIRIVDALGDPRPGAAAELDPFDTWKIERTSAKLADRLRRQPQPGSAAAPAGLDQADYTRILTAYRLHELHLPHADDSVRRVFTDLHADWLPTYQAALDTYDHAPAADPDAPWRAPDTYYGRLATACEPFLLELGRRLESARDRNPAARSGLVDRRVVADLQNHLLDRFDLHLAWAVEAEGNVHCARTGLDKAAATEADYLAFLDTAFADGAAYHSFYLRYPVLGRWLAHVTRLLADYGAHLIDRLCADAADLSAAFFESPITRFRALTLGHSDPHAGAQQVAFVQVDLDNGRTGSLVYKPRSIAAEAAVQDLLTRIRESGAVDFATRAVLDRGAYGYEAAIPAGRNRVGATADVDRVYRQLGGYLALFYVLGGGDLHFENILVADGNAYVCDCETVLGARPEGQIEGSGTLLDSVFNTGLLEWPRPAVGADGAAAMNISGYAGGTAYEMPIAVPRVSGPRMTFAASVTHEEGVRVAPTPANRVFLGDHLVDPGDHADAITTGFSRVYDWFRQWPDRTAQHVADAFSGATLRFINRATQVYAQALLSARHPKALADPLEVDLLARVVRAAPRVWDTHGVLAECELQSLWRMDIPLFTVGAHDRRLVHDHTTAVASYLAQSPVQGAAERIRRLSPENRTQQRHYIAAGLSAGEISSPSFVTAARGQAERIGLRLCDQLRDPGAPAPWTSYRLDNGTPVEADIEADLYLGSAGIALFLAYLDHLTPDPRVRAAAERALHHALAHADDHRRIGAFTGTGGLVYLLTHLHHLWGDPALLDRAVRLTAGLGDRIEADPHLDILGGAAGLIPVLLGLAAAADGAGLTEAVRCADHLLRRARDNGDTLSWPQQGADPTQLDLTGFTHGAAGMGWALIQLGVRIDRPDYIAAGRRAFAYESYHFDPTAQDWYDLRTFGGGVVRENRHYANAWCNGAAGIGLSRISAWDLLGRDDDLLLREAGIALAATVRNFPRLMNDTLCHGRSGNAELLLRYGRLHDDPAFQLEANVQVQNQWRTFDEARHGITGDSTDFFPGLMLGISGMGMHFLRLAAPDRVPSVLLLDPPATDSAKG